MQPNGPRHFVDIAPPPPRPPRPAVPTQPPNVTKIPVNIDSPKQPAVLPQFTPLTQVQPQPMPTVQPQAFVPQPTTPPAEPPKFGALQSKVDAHPLFSGARDSEPKKARGWISRIFWIIAILLVIAATAYIVIDSGAVNSNINLPFHVFKQTTSSLEEI